MYQPLADALRPQNLDDVCGQSHILGENGLLRRIIDSGKIPNMIFYGPSGTGKTFSSFASSFFSSMDSAPSMTMAQNNCPSISFDNSFCLLI